MTKSIKVSVILGVFLLVCATAFAADEQLRYEADFGLAAGYLDLFIDDDEDVCAGSLMLVVDHEGEETEFETDLYKCLVWKRTKDDKGNVTALAIQFMQVKDDNYIYLGWVTVNKPEQVKSFISGYYVKRGEAMTHPWWASYENQ